MGSRSLVAKHSNGSLVTFDSCGKSFVDGTLQADFPKQRLAQMFQCSQFIVSQVNPHIAPFIRRDVNHNGTISGCEPQREPLQKLEDWMAIDIKHRVQTLSNLGLMPTLFGKDVSPLFTQRWVEYKSGVMLVPSTLRLSEVLQAIRNPTSEDMCHYLLEGRRCVWGKVEQLRHLLSLEHIFEDCITELEARIGEARVSLPPPRPLPRPPPPPPPPPS